MIVIKNMYLGLDIGTDSVGYAVTDEQYSLRKFHGEPAWGVTLFDAAAQASERRAHRVDRRRLDRRQQRIQLLEELFAKEICKVDPRFFIRQAESALYPEDKEEAYSIFNDVNYTDVQYHRDFPTIHHLIDRLMYSDEPQDVRLVYLACAWLVAHRGHFLSKIDKSNVSAVTDFSSVYNELRRYFIDNDCVIPWQEDNLAGIAEAMRMDTGVNRKAKALGKACFGDAKVPREPSEEFPYSCEDIFKALAGGKVSAAKLFDKDAYAEIESFSLDMDEESMSKLIAGLGDDAELIVRLKAIYDWPLLAKALEDGENRACATISKAKIAVYEQHQSDLRLLKRIIRKYQPDQYAPMFRSDSQAGNYVSYSYHGIGEKTKKADQEAFCKYVASIVKGIVPDKEDQSDFEKMLVRLENRTFMPKQKTGDNRVIPYQLYWHELNCLLMRAEGYLPFLSQADENGLTVSEKIRRIFTFRIPYFVGPLGKLGDPKNHWAVRANPGRILPWNLETMIDQDASEEAFIRSMTNTCTYLPGEKVLPRDSLYYHRFSVLNEINNIKVNDVPISVEQKQRIYSDVFMCRARVRRKHIQDYMISNGMMAKGDTLSGIDIEIKSNLKPQHDFKRLLEAGLINEADAERIIERRTYSEDNERFMRWLRREYAQLSEEDVQYLCRLRYKDFGRLSRCFLIKFEGVNRQTGEITTIMQALWETNDNLMELLSDRYTFADAIEAEQKQYYEDHHKSMDERLEDMRVPVAVRRPILRALDITREVVKAFGGAPERIFVEMARGGEPEQKGKRTITRKNQLLSLYEQCRDEDVRELKEALEAMGEAADARLQSEKLFLYFLQMGRCMYTGKAIDLNGLLADKRYDVDHIYPQSLVKDDSIFNNKVLVVSEENHRKGNGVVPSDIQNKMLAIWTHMKTCGLINDEKFKRLTRTRPFAADEKMDFINRQLTETSQASKVVSTLLRELYPDTKVVYVKARLAADFRQEFDRIKSRDYNDLHHAKDAYLNVVVGNVYHEKFTSRWFSVDRGYTLNTEAIFTRPVICGNATVWDGTPMLEKVKAILLKNNAHMTRYEFKRQGGLFDQLPVKKGEGLVPLKKGMDTKKYGGYNKATVSFFVLVQFTIGKKKDIMIMPVELMDAPRYLADAAFRTNYALGMIGKIRNKKVDSVVFPLGKRILKINTVISLDGFRMCLAGKSSGGKVIGLSGQMPFIADYGTERYIKRMRSLSDKIKNNPKYVFSSESDKISSEENIRLYDRYVEKLQKSTFSKHPTHPLTTLLDGRDTFLQLSPLTQMSVLLNIHAFFGRSTYGVDLREINGSGRSAVPGLSSVLSNWKKRYADIRIIDQSASGLWETKSQNLLDLL